MIRILTSMLVGMLINASVLSKEKMMDVKEMEVLLDREKDYPFYFGDKYIDKLLAKIGDIGKLKEVVRDKKASIKARFFAAELLFFSDKSYKEDEGLLAEIYSEALESNIISGNAWGLQGEVGWTAGKNLVMIGKPMINNLTKLLDIVYYEGSEEATIGNSYRYIIKDLAAFFIARILGIRFDIDIKPMIRDKSIMKLKEDLKNMSLMKE